MIIVFKEMELSITWDKIYKEAVVIYYEGNNVTEIFQKVGLIEEINAEYLKQLNH